MTMPFGKLLEEITGISPRILGEKNLARAIKERMSVCKLEDEKKYFERIQFSAKEIEAFINVVVVSETSFFRDKEPFHFLGRYVRDEWKRKHTAGVLRILSAPCSSGEEPYSIALALQDAGLAPEEYQIDAVDISQALLDKAKLAVFSQHSFRGVPEPLRSRHFVQEGREYVLQDAGRHGVRFICGNLLDFRTLDGGQPYDIIFCRNLLIYFGPEARVRLIDAIERVLVPSGLLFVGHAEMSCFSSAKFASLENRSAFGFRKVERQAAAMDLNSPSVISSPPLLQMKPIKYKETKQPLNPAPEASKRKDSLQAAQQMADRGRLLEAADICERLLLADKANASIYSLLGVVQHGLGNLANAEACFTRAIYLDESCYDAMIHLSLIKEFQGDCAGAQVLKRRAARIHLRTGTS
jgi:chemotaxis protein methyltransferase WspC